MVFSDVNSALGCALAAAKAGVPVIHVEAGLRSGDWSMPEEVNRIVIDRVSSLHLATEDSAVGHLRAEGIPEDRIRLVGNTMVDVLRRHRDAARVLGCSENTVAWRMHKARKLLRARLRPFLEEVRS